MTTRIGPYEVVREVARGGMGVVLQVRHPNVPRPLALKLILDRDSTKLVQRFQREAQILAQCDRHPNVLKVHQLGTDQGRPFLVTDFIEGDPLSKSLPLEPRRAATVIRKVADALAYVHSKGVLHRDVKPDNILLRQDDPDEPILIDFGLAWAAEAERLTRTGSTLGTPAYMSPEQAGGGAGAQLDARSDVYSLGATLYAALTGNAPFEGDSLTELVAKIITEPASLPSDSREGVPPGLDAICLVALAKKPEARFADAAAMRDDLDRFLRGETPLALKRVPRRGPSRRALALGGAGLVVALGAAAFALTLLADRGRRGGAERLRAAAMGAVHAATVARRSDEARSRIDALDAAVHALAAPDPRVERAAALLHAEVEARDAREASSPDKRERALEKAVVAARAYLAFPAGADELIDELAEREATLAAALADGGPDDVARALVDRTESTARPVLLERARALLRLGKPSAATRAAAKVSGSDALAAEAQWLAALGAFEARELATARSALAPLLQAKGDAASHARAIALAARVELAAGEPGAAMRLLDATQGEDAELVLARVETGLVRRIPATALAASAREVVVRARDESLALRAGELLARIQLLATLEPRKAREAPPSLDDVRGAVLETLGHVGKPGSVGGEGAGTGRFAAGRALVLLAALQTQHHDDRGAAEALARAASLAPASIDVALALAASGSSAGAAGTSALPQVALERAAEELPSLAGALRAVMPGKAAADASAARGAEGALERGALQLLLLARAPAAAGAEIAAAEDELRRAGTLDALLLELAEERLAYEEQGETLALYALSARRLRDEPDAADLSMAHRFEESLALAGAQAVRARADAAVASVAGDMALALRPQARTAVLLRAAVTAALLRGERADVMAALDLSAGSAASRAEVELHGGAAAIAKEALARLGAAEPLAAGDDVERARAALVRGRLLGAAGRGAEALEQLHAAAQLSEKVLARRDDEALVLGRLAEAGRVHSAALHDTVTVTEQTPASSLGVGAARSNVEDDIEDRGRALVGLVRDVVGLRRLLRTAGASAAELGVTPDAVSEVLARREAVLARLRAAPQSTWPLELCVEADIDAGRGPRAWGVQARYFLGRGALGSVCSMVQSRFGSYLANDNAGSGITLLSRESIDAEVASGAAGDPAPLLARATAEVFFATRTHIDAAEQRGALERAEADLLRVRRIAPGATVVLPLRAAVALASRRPAEAAAFFDATHEVDAWTLTPPGYLAFEVLIAVRTGDRELAKKALAAIRDAPSPYGDDVALIEARPFQALLDDPELGPVLAAAINHYRGARR